MDTLINRHGTKIYGALTSFFGTVGGLVATGAFNELLSKQGVGWLGITCSVATAVLGGMTAARGFNNTARVEVARAMETAIKADPPKEGA
jgi:hypothetical protein